MSTPCASSRGPQAVYITPPYLTVFEPGGREKQRFSPLLYVNAGGKKRDPSPASARPPGRTGVRATASPPSCQGKRATQRRLRRRCPKQVRPPISQPPATAAKRHCGKGPLRSLLGKRLTFAVRVTAPPGDPDTFLYRYALHCAKSVRCGDAPRRGGATPPLYAVNTIGPGGRTALLRPATTGRWLRSVFLV